MRVFKMCREREGHKWEQISIFKGKQVIKKTFVFGLFKQINDRFIIVDLAVNKKIYLGSELFEIVSRYKYDNFALCG